MIKKGFTIIEVLVTLIILSMIAVISLNILQSSLISEKQSSDKLNSITKLNLASSILRRDIRQIANVPIKDFYGNRMNGTFINKYNSENLMFTTKTKSLSNEVSPLKRVIYAIEDKNLVRRQYFSSNPYSADDYVQLNLINNIGNFKTSFFHKKKWYQSWPINQTTAKELPTLVKVEFTFETNALKKSLLLIKLFNCLKLLGFNPISSAGNIPTSERTEYLPPIKLL